MKQQKPKRVTRRRFLKWTAGLGLSAGAAGLGSLAYASQVEPQSLVAENVTIGLPRLPRAFEGLLLAQLSDLHLGPWVGEQHLTDAVALANQARPDVAVITGDLINSSWQYMAPCVRALSQLRAPLGVYVVFGNHDYYVGYLAQNIATIKNAGLTLLRNQALALARGNAQLYLVGVDDWALQQADLARALTRVPRGACKLALIHEPDFADYAAQGEIDLQLSGHSHGGQVRLPGVGPLILPQYGRKYPMGLARVGNFTQVYTTRGVGVLPPAFRFNCPPEVTLLRLTSEPQT